MAFRAVLDACVLFPFSLRDTLLRLAERELYDIVWSDRILEEMRRNLVSQDLVDEQKSHRLVATMDGAFDAALVPSRQVEELETLMTNDPKDRHVLAAAVASGAEAVVTANLQDFSASSCEPWGIDAISPDDFLLILLAKRPEIVVQVLHEQAADLVNPPLTYAQLVDALAKTVPKFAAALRDMGETVPV